MPVIAEPPLEPSAKATARPPLAGSIEVIAGAAGATAVIVKERVAVAALRPPLAAIAAVIAQVPPLRNVTLPEVAPIEQALLDVE